LLTRIFFTSHARLTEVMLLGIVALRSGKKIYYDGSNMRATSVLQPNDFLRQDYRRGWSIKKGSRRTWTRSGICQVRLESSFVGTKSCAAVRQPCPATGQCRGGETEL